MADTLQTPTVWNPSMNGTGATFDSQSTYGSYWTPGTVVGDWLSHQDTFAHNEALAAWQRESTFNAQEAQKARDFEKMMSDTQFQRKVADVMNAGFSPLAALESNGSYNVSSAPAAAAHANPAKNGSNGFGGMLGALMMAIATFATKGMASAAVNSANASKAALDAQKLEVLKDQVQAQKGWLELAKNGRTGAGAIAAEKVLRKAANGKTSPYIDWDKLLDELDNI